ncbi:hypothetical protein ACKWTF_000627 [Chironomus riparius]
MDFYSYIRLVNFIRSNKIMNPKDLVSTDSSPLWLDEKYMKPAADYESWLSYDFDELEISEATSQTDKVIKDLRDELKIKDQMLQQALEDMTLMKESYKRLMGKEESTSSTQKKKNQGSGVASVSLESDSSYFESYSHFSIHHSMLSDTVRTESYRDAILKNSEAFKDKDVLDIGCGTSILSLFASQSGAKHVYAVDQSDIIYHAMEIAQINNFNNVKFLKGRLEDIEMPFEKVDIIISEWMGYFLFFEGMLDSIIYGRNNYLKEGGLILPNRCNVSIVGYGCEDRYNNFIKFFDNVYGYNMKCILKDILREAHVEKCHDEFVLTKPNIICELDINTCDLSYSNFTYDFSLDVTKDSKMTSIVGYFDTFFDLPQEKVSFSTSPAATPTHWQQAVFYLDEPVDVKVGDVVTGKFICQRDRKDLRSLNVEIRVFGKVFKYDLN